MKSFITSIVAVWSVLAITDFGQELLKIALAGFVSLIVQVVIRLLDKRKIKP